MQKVCIFVISLLISGSVFAGGGGDGEVAKPLEGSHPIVLVHGLFGWGDSESSLLGIGKYWGGMDDHLRAQGVPVLAPYSLATQSSAHRAGIVKNKVNEWMAANGYQKVHLIGHSQGGLDIRYLASNLNMSHKIATVTTLNSVHTGSPTADIVEGAIPDWLEPYVGTVVEALIKLVYGGDELNALAAMNQLTTTGVAAFNATTPDTAGVKYFSYGSKMTLPDPIQHPFMFAIFPVTTIGGTFKGQGATNDGLVPLTSQKWGTWMGGPSYSLLVSGVDHLQACNGVWTGNAWYDVEGYFLAMGQNAKNNQ